MTLIVSWLIGTATVLLACAAVETAWAAWRWHQERRYREEFIRWYRSQ